MQHLTVLDGLRGFAALLVVIAHAAHYGFLPPVFSAKLGATGVAVFYVLSGFLMAYLYSGTSPTFTSLRTYFLNRLSRVLPLFYVVLIGSTFLFLMSGQSVYAFNSVSEFFSNFLLIRGTGVLWSIPVEIHYYVAFSLIWIASQKFSPGGIVITVSLTQIALIWLLTDGETEYRWLLFYVHLFLAGHVVGVAFTRKGSLLVILSKPVLSVGVGVLTFVALILLLDDVQNSLGVSFRSGIEDPLVSIFAVVVLLSALARSPLLNFFRGNLMRFMGRISYSLYLVHMPVMLVVYGVLDLEGEKAYGMFVPVFAVCIVLSVAANRLIEVPAQRFLRNKYDDRAAVG